jgi:hypothetical protein
VGWGRGHMLPPSPPPLRLSLHNGGHLSLSLCLPHINGHIQPVPFSLHVLVWCAAAVCSTYRLLLRSCSTRITALLTRVAPCRYRVSCAWSCWEPRHALPVSETN